MAEDSRSPDASPRVRSRLQVLVLAQPSRSARLLTELRGTERRGAACQLTERSGTERKGERVRSTERSGTERKGAAAQSTERSGTERRGDPATATDRRGTDRRGEASMSTERSGTERSGAESSTTLRRGTERSGDWLRSTERSGTERRGRSLRSAPPMLALSSVWPDSESGEAHDPREPELSRAHHWLAAPEPGSTPGSTLSRVAPPRAKAARGRSRNTEPDQSTSVTVSAVTAAGRGSSDTTCAQVTLTKGALASVVPVRIVCHCRDPFRGRDDKLRGTPSRSKFRDTNDTAPSTEPDRSEARIGADWSPEAPASRMIEPGVGLGG